jgi:Amt family ammonium transporter
MIMFGALNAVGLLRVSAEGEVQGLDLHEHGIPAYPEYALHASATPHGSPEFVDSMSRASATEPVGAIPGLASRRA